MPDRVLTPETRAALERILPFAPDAFVRFTPPVYLTLPEEYRPTYHVRPVPSADRSEFLARSRDPGVDGLALQAEVLGKTAVAACENYREIGVGATPVAVNWSPACLGRLSAVALGQLWDLAFDLANGPKPEEREGLGSSPPSTSAPSTATADGADVARA